jgi:hypothetical protein
MLAPRWHFLQPWRGLRKPSFTVARCSLSQPLAQGISQGSRGGTRVLPASRRQGVPASLA